MCYDVTYTSVNQLPNKCTFIAFHHSRPSKKRRKKEEPRRSGSLRVRSVSELAKLVSTGAICLPKSLTHYVDDRAQLLDQVFTILSPSDVRGMLPDILKVRPS